MLVKKIYAILLLTLISTSGFAKDYKADDILGFWLAESGSGVIEIYKKGDEYLGKLVWIKDIHEGKVKEKLDENNPDKDKRSRSLIGLVNLKGFEFKDNEWSGGEIYDPKKGKTYSAFMKLDGKDTLKLRGYVGVSLFGRTTEWSRQKHGHP